MAVVPAASARATSSALAARTSAVRSTRRSAAASRAASLASVAAVASTRLAALARRPSSAIGGGDIGGASVGCAARGGRRATGGTRRRPGAWPRSLGPGVPDDPIFDVAHPRRRRRRAGPADRRRSSPSRPASGCKQATAWCSGERDGRGAVGARRATGGRASPTASGWRAPIVRGTRWRRAGRSWRRCRRIEKAHPKEPHWYLGVLGTDPDHQGKGIGAALLAPVLERCDREGMPAYLESSKESNIPYYERFGSGSQRELPARQGRPDALADVARSRLMAEHGSARRRRRPLRRRPRRRCSSGWPSRRPTPTKLRTRRRARGVHRSPAAFLAADGRQTDDELWELIAAFGPHLDTAARRGDARRRAPLGHRRAAGAEASREPQRDVRAARRRRPARRHPPRPHLLRRRPRGRVQRRRRRRPHLRPTSWPPIEAFRGRLLERMAGTASSPTPGRARPAAEPPTQPPAAAGAARADRGPPGRARRPRRHDVGEARGPPRRRPHPHRAAAPRARPPGARAEPAPRVHRQPRHRQDDRRPAAVAHLPHASASSRRATSSRPTAPALVAGYVGQTATKVVAVFDAADQGTLLIDEAYALVRGGDERLRPGGDRHDREAGRGPPRPRRRHRSPATPRRWPTSSTPTPGLTSRFPKTIHFPDYSGDELWRSCASTASKGQYELTPARRGQGAGVARRRAPRARASATAASPATCSRRRGCARRRGSPTSRRRPTSSSSRLEAADVLDPRRTPAELHRPPVQPAAARATTATPARATPTSWGRTSRSPSTSRASSDGRRPGRARRARRRA